MDERENFVEDFASVHRLLDLTVSDLTIEQALWQPGGTTSAMATILVHTVYDEDFILNRYFNKRPLVLETDDWSTKSGIPADNDAIWAGGLDL